MSFIGLIFLNHKVQFTQNNAVAVRFVLTLNIKTCPVSNPVWSDEFVVHETKFCCIFLLHLHIFIKIFYNSITIQGKIQILPKGKTMEQVSKEPLKKKILKMSKFFKCSY